MGFIDKFKKKNFNEEEVIKVENKNRKPKSVEIKEAQVKLDSVKQLQPKLLPTKTKTLERLEDFTNLKILLDELKQQHIKDIERIDNILNSLNITQDKVADFVKDTTDNQYKNVKDIVINKSMQSDLVFYKGGYMNMENILNNLSEVPLAKHAKYSEESGVANKIRFNNGVHSLDDILQEYLNTNDWTNILNKSTNFEQFKTHLQNVIKLK